MLKKIAAIIFVCEILSLTACGNETSTLEPSLAVETKATEESMENTTEDITDVEMDDEEYLINLGKQLKLGMTDKEVFEKLGEPDIIWPTSFRPVIVYVRGNCELSVVGVPVCEVRVYNKETKKSTSIYPVYEEWIETTE